MELRHVGLGPLQDLVIWMRTRLSFARQYPITPKLQKRPDKCPQELKSPRAAEATVA